MPAEADVVDEPAEPFEMRIGKSLVSIFTESDRPIQQIGLLREALAQRHIRMPILRIRDFSYLDDNQYEILIDGQVVGTGKTNAFPVIRSHLKKIAQQNARSWTIPQMDCTEKVVVATN